ncbi:unnamed protein product [Cercospora beticola]|nr:unnamed protein product [Cercospora beticola]
MLTQVLGMRKQMSLFKFNWDWVSVERHLAILEIIRDFHCRPDAVDSDKRLSEWALSAHLNYFAWNEVVRGIQEESDWLREHAIESPGQELLARLNTCRSLLAKLKKQLSGGRDKNEILGLSWLQAHMVGLEKLDDGVQREEVTVQSHMSDGETIKGATVASMNEQQSNENGGEPQTSDHAQADKEASTLGDLNDEDNLTPLNIDHKYIGIKADLEKLEDEVQETFQLLAISIQIKDTGVARTQARRATALTVIATIYLPATLAVGAFGMNVQYLGGDLSIMWPIILFAALFAPSAIVLLFLFLRE